MLESEVAAEILEERSGNGLAPPTYEEIAALAYQLWEQRGGGDGDSELDWLEAERRLAIRTREGIA